LAGLNWLLETTFPGRSEPGCDVVNLSFSFPKADPAIFARLLEAVERHKVVPVAGTGNDAGLPGSPSDFAHVLGVGALEVSGAAWTRTNRSTSPTGRFKPELWAPGVGLTTAHSNGGWRTDVEGTSFSAPLVSGACALVHEHLRNSSQSAIGVVSALLSAPTAQKVHGVPGLSVAVDSF
jgi:subtilisin family serine protease